MGIIIDKCRTCKHAFTTGKDRWYCKKSLADKDDCGEYEMTEEGMTIDKAIEIINHYLDYPKEEVRKALLVAINAMRKYEKIQEIVEHWACCGNPSDSMIAIRKILEDGNDD